MFTWALSSTHQLTALQTSSDGVHSRLQQCIALTSSSGGRESRCQLSEALQHLYIADFPEWVRVLGDYQGRRTQDQCSPSMVSPSASRYQVVSLHLQ